MIKTLFRGAYYFTFGTCALVLGATTGYCLFAAFYGGYMAWGLNGIRALPEILMIVSISGIYGFTTYQTLRQLARTLRGEPIKVTIHVIVALLTTIATAGIVYVFSRAAHDM